MSSWEVLSGTVAILGVTLLSGAASSTAELPESGSHGVLAGARDDSIVVGAIGRAPVVAGAPTQVDAPQRRFIYRTVARHYCGTLDAWSTGTPCVDDAPSGRRTQTCSDGTLAADPRERREVDPESGSFIGEWEQVDPGGCSEDPEPAGTVGLSAEEFRRLPLVSSTPQIQPGHGRALVNVDLIVFTDPAPQELETTVLGVPVTVRAVPVEFTWDFGDGTVVQTEDAGAPYPRQTVVHPYARPGEYRVQLTTTWSGQFQAAGTGVWHPVAGTAVTVSEPFDLAVEEARSRLVAEPLTGTGP